MKEELGRFTLYYKAKHSGRALSWDHGLGTATLKARFSPGVKELSVSLYQAAVLLLFNQSSQISLQEIKDQTEMGKSFFALVPVYLIEEFLL
jgi:cullin-4